MARVVSGMAYANAERDGNALRDRDKHRTPGHSYCCAAHPSRAPPTQTATSRVPPSRPLQSPERRATRYSAR